MKFTLILAVLSVGIAACPTKPSGILYTKKECQQGCQTVTGGDVQKCINERCFDCK